MLARYNRQQLTNRYVIPHGNTLFEGTPPRVNHRVVLHVAVRADADARGVAYELFSPEVVQ